MHTCRQRWLEAAVGGRCCEAGIRQQTRWAWGETCTPPPTPGCSTPSGIARPRSERCGGCGSRASRQARGSTGSSTPTSCTGCSCRTSRRVQLAGVQRPDAAAAGSLRAAAPWCIQASAATRQLATAGSAHTACAHPDPQQPPQLGRSTARCCLSWRPTSPPPSGRWWTRWPSCGGWAAAAAAVRR